MTAARFDLTDLEQETDRRVRKLWGRPPINLYRILAHQPRIVSAWTEWNNELRYGCMLPRALRELIFLRSAILQKSVYEWAQHVAMARKAGVDETQIEAIEYWQAAHVFNPRERAVLRCTDEITAGELSDHAFVALREIVSPGEAIEVIVTASHACMLARVIQALAVTDDGERPATAAATPKET
jgi:AhpD family alkylhydroperoxidase